MNDDRVLVAPKTPAAGLVPPAGRSIVLVGIMGAGKTSIGRRLAARLGLPFRDADQEIEQAAGCSIAEIFARFGEPAFRDGEKRVIKRLLAAEPIVLAAGGGAYMDAETRAAIRASAVSVWLRSTLPVLLRRVAHRTHRPLLNADNPETVLRRLMAARYPTYAEADITVDCGDETPEATTEAVLRALVEHQPPRRLAVALSHGGYDVVVGEGLLARSCSLLGPVLPQRRAVVVTDEHVGALHATTLASGLTEAGFETGEPIVVPPGETTKSAEAYLALAGALLDRRVERRTAVIALGGGVVGDLAGFAAATVLRGLPFVQVPTTLLAQVDSSVGGKTGINTRQGKNLLGAFHQPRAVLADVAVLATLPGRELRAGYAEIAKAGLIGDAPLFEWCETHAAALLAGDTAVQAEAVWRACAFKARVVGDDEREEKPNDGRALLNLGHTFGHAVEAECGYGQVLHGEAVAVGLGLALRLSARLGYCDASLAERVEAHLDASGLPATMGHLNRRLSAQRLVAHMARDKKVRDGKLAFVLARGIGQAFTSTEVAPEAVLATLRDSGCTD